MLTELQRFALNASSPNASATHLICSRIKDQLANPASGYVPIKHFLEWALSSMFDNAMNCM